jgi:hypothetical protein
MKGRIIESIAASPLAGEKFAKFSWMDGYIQLEKKNWTHMNLIPEV